MSDLMPWFAPWSGRLPAALLFVLGITMMVSGWRRMRLTEPACPRCRYSLRGLASHTCPECGHACADERDLWRRPRRRWMIVLGLAIALALPIFVIQRRVRQYGWEYYTYYGPFYWFSPERTLQRLEVNGLVVRVVRDRRPWNTEKTIRFERGGRAVEAWTDYHIELEPIQLPGPSSRRKHLLVRSHSGGAHCCGAVNVFTTFPETVGDKQRIKSQHSDVEFHDLDGDGTPEAELRDWTYAYWLTSFAGSPAPRVVLEWDGDRFVASAKHMQRSSLPTDLSVRRHTVRAGLRLGGPGEAVYSALLAIMLDLIYTGNAGEAWSFLKTAWPDDVPGRTAFERDLRQQLAFSPYYAVLIELNGSALTDAPLQAASPTSSSP